MLIASKVAKVFTDNPELWMLEINVNSKEMEMKLMEILWLFLSKVPLKYVDYIKFLGITFYERLTWKQHIRGLVHSCQKALNILKCLANKHWGSDGKTLLSLYRSLIRSKIDYGCIAYASASPSTLKQLDTLHNSALRLILGAFRTTPVDSLYCESGEAPLHSRRQILSLAHAAKVKSNPRHPVYKKISPSRSTTFNCRLYRKPFHVRIQQYLQEINQFSRVGLLVDAFIGDFQLLDTDSQLDFRDVPSRAGIIFEFKLRSVSVAAFLSTQIKVTLWGKISDGSRPSLLVDAFLDGVQLLDTDSQLDSRDVPSRAGIIFAFEVRSVSIAAFLSSQIKDIGTLTV
nr:unnamed protein product [Callosobruchus chinensis]